METLLELFDERPLENVLATEVFRPRRTVFLAPSEIAEDGALLSRIGAFFRGRNVPAELIALPCDMNDPLSVESALREAAAKWPDCALNISGGKDAALFAAGWFAAGASLPVFTWSRRRQRFFNVRSAPFAEVDTRYLRYGVADFLRMAGGGVREGRMDPGALPRHLWLAEPFFRIFMDHRRSWVQTVNWMQAASPSGKNGDPLAVSAPDVLKAQRGTAQPDPETLRALSEIGMILDLAVSRDTVSFSFADTEVRAWLRDIGSVLELAVYKACLDSGLFDEARISVVVEWAGRKETDGVENEIDVVACRGISPLFISCKTSEIKTEALNELAILRDRFGGGMAKALIVTAENAGIPARNRASELGIAVADAADLADEETFIARLRALAE